MSNFFKETDKKNIYLYVSIIALTIIIVLTVFVIMDIYYKENAKDIEISTINALVENNQINSNSTASDTVSTSLDNTINSLKNENSNNMINENIEKKAEESSSVNNKNVIKKSENIVVEKTTNTIEGVESENVEKEFKIMAPVEGEIVKDFAVESLLYSETLKEWTTHIGIDIKADKTTVVKSGYKGIVESIKNDPRYGLTITIDHENGYKTIYSNLLTSEFVNEGDSVEEGQTIGTVGESAAFESLEEPHLHFEVLKDNINVNPTLYLK